MRVTYSSSTLKTYKTYKVFRVDLQGMQLHTFKRLQVKRILEFFVASLLEYVLRRFKF
jgi:hypothetical protein